MTCSHQYTIPENECIQVASKSKLIERKQGRPAISSNAYTAYHSKEIHGSHVLSTLIVKNEDDERPRKKKRKKTRETRYCSNKLLVQS